jgi:hypothetical protein
MNNSDSDCTKKQRNKTKSMAGGEWWVMCAVLDARDVGCVFVYVDRE